jgi:hypothetical protein
MSTWTTQLTTLEQRAAEHDKFSKQLIGNLADPLKHLATRYEELRKVHADYAAKLEKERDNSYADLRKMKGRYDSVCQDVENKRKKVDGAFDMSKGKAQASFAQHSAEMHNVKNTYIISINVTNKQKERYYHVYVPELLDSLQDLNETRVGSLNGIWSRAAALERQTLSTSVEYVDHMAAEIPRNDPKLDSLMFARHNAVAQWPEPPDMVFEPSPVWLDTDALAADEQAKNFLRNVLTKSKGQLTQLKRDADTKSREVEGARRVRQLIREGKDKRDEVEIVRAIFDLSSSLHDVERQRVSAEVEISTITTAVGDVSIGARNHNFKSETFKIPTNCDLCGDRIWGINAKGFICRDCGFTCHSKCEMKCPADCPGELGKEEKKKMKLERQEAAKVVAATPANGANGSHVDVSQSSASSVLQRSDTMNTLSSGYSATAHRSVSGTPSISTATEEEPPLMSPTAAAPTPVKKAPVPAAVGGRRNRIVAPPPTKYVTPEPEPPSATDGTSGSKEPRGRMMYPYTAGGEGEITVSDGQEVVIVEPDGMFIFPMSHSLNHADNDLDGSGWLRVRSGADTGLVPASYVETLPNAPTPTPASARPASTYSNSSSHTASSSIAAAGAAKKKGPAVAPRRGAKRIKYVEALYDYDARTEAEHSIREGERVVLVSKDSGDGWCDVEKDGRTGSVPSAYVKEV